jgi:hypothetical protein
MVRPFHPVKLNLPKTIDERLQVCAEKQGISLNQAIINILLNSMDELEDLAMVDFSIPKDDYIKYQYALSAKKMLDFIRANAQSYSTWSRESLLSCYEIMGLSSVREARYALRELIVGEILEIFEYNFKTKVRIKVKYNEG